MSFWQSLTLLMHQEPLALLLSVTGSLLVAGLWLLLVFVAWQSRQHRQRFKSYKREELSPLPHIPPYVTINRAGGKVRILTPTNGVGEGTRKTPHYNDY